MPRQRRPRFSQRLNRPARGPTKGMQYRTLALPVMIVPAVAWNAFVPKTTGFDDSRECPNLGEGAAKVCLKKPL